MATDLDKKMHGDTKRTTGEPKKNCHLRLGKFNCNYFVGMLKLYSFVQIVDVQRHQCCLKLEESSGCFQDFVYELEVRVLWQSLLLMLDLDASCCLPPEFRLYKGRVTLDEDG